MANPLQFYGLLKKPLLTEKSTIRQEKHNQFMFKVAPHANKSEIKKAVETLFEVEVVRVNTANMPRKLRRFLGRPGRTAPWKKAIVTLAEGQTIDLT